MKVFLQVLNCLVIFGAIIAIAICGEEVKKFQYILANLQVIAMTIACMAWVGRS